jgi:hypothetical protein
MNLKVEDTHLGRYYGPFLAPLFPLPSWHFVQPKTRPRCQQPDQDITHLDERDTQVPIQKTINRGTTIRSLGELISK